MEDFITGNNFFLYHEGGMQVFLSLTLQGVTRNYILVKIQRIQGGHEEVLV